MDQFNNNKITVNYNMSGDVTLRYSKGELLEMMKNEVAQRFGKYAIEKSERSFHESPSTLDVMCTHTCYIFSERDLEALAAHIKVLEDENRWMRFEVNRKAAGHFDNI